MITLKRSLLKKETKKEITKPDFIIDYPDFETFYSRYEKVRNLENLKKLESLKTK